MCLLRLSLAAALHRCGDADVLECLSLGEPRQNRGALPLDEGDDRVRFHPGEIPQDPTDGLADEEVRMVGAGQAGLRLSTG